MKRLSLILAAAAVIALPGCASIPGGTEIAAVATSAVDALTGPDTDYKNYLTHCRAEVRAQHDAHAAESKAMEAALTSGNEKTQYGATLIMAFKAGQGGPRIGCTVDRKQGFTELLLKNNNLLGAGIQVIDMQQRKSMFKKQLAADERMARDRMDFQRDMADRQNRLITTLTGDEKDLRGQQNEFELERQRLDQQAPPPAQ